MKALRLTPSLFPRRFLGAALIFALFSGMECEKDPNAPDTLPAITQEGRNTFGCLVNDVVFLPRGGGFTIVFQVEKQGNNFNLTMADSKGGTKGLILRFEVSGSSGTFGCGEYYNDVCTYNLCPPLNSQISISKYDQVNKIISGEFSFNLPAKGSCPAINITQGRFDLKFK